ncbi:MULTISPECIES: hypothetical protein [Protofrankia]|uniref:Uncharacterized protein n=1 Tax=Candidatus Protofrankia datiscae TaxID=2716812 RepID=F8B420_9ACTN|nr:MULTISPECIES: hypothetical protein [Protofrankia]AEH10036.1 hypothetical protein FsymDg_2685 [Candidatus Protofrankia datiscae]
MIPTISQQLRGIRSAMAKSIVPALPAGDSFVQEQAGLVLATLDWVLDVQESETLYEATERDEYRELLDRLSALSSVPATDAHAVPAPDPSAIPDLALLRVETQALKVAVDARFTAIAADGSAEDRAAARELLVGVAARQSVREQAWFRMTGFPSEVHGDIRSVLTGNATTPGQDAA